MVLTQGSADGHAHGDSSEVATMHAKQEDALDEARDGELTGKGVPKEDGDDDDVKSEKDDDDDDNDGFRLCEESGLSEQDRRIIRSKQRQLLHDLETNDAINVDDARKLNNRIFRKVKYTREAVLDSDNLKAIAGRASKAVEDLIKAPRYDATRLVDKIVQKCRVSSGGGNSNGYFDWGTLGEAASVCFNAIPSNVSFLNGPLTDGAELQLRQRAQRQPRRIVEEAEEAEPDQVKKQVMDADKLSAAEKLMKEVNKTLKKKCEDAYKTKKRALQEELNGENGRHVSKKLRKRGPEINAVKFMFNPKSFTQTVENVFTFSFLVKRGVGAIQVRKPEQYQLADGTDVTFESGPVCRNVAQSSSNHPVAKQAIVTLTMKDWRDLCRAYDVQQSDISHRTGSRHAVRSPAPSQS